MKEIKSDVYIPIMPQSDAHRIKFLESGDMLWCCGDKLG